MVRVHGPTGPGSQSPAGATTELLDAVVRSAAASVFMDGPESAAVGSRQLVWGVQVDCEPIAATDPHDPAQLVHDRHLAGYVAKYATKGTGHTGGADTPIRSEQHIADLDVSAHARATMQTAWDLGGLPEFGELRLRKWAHMPGFRGHFLTKSRRYSTTFTPLARGPPRATLRAGAGRTWHRRLGRRGRDFNDWTMTGIGYRNDAERQLAEAIAAKAMERRKASRPDLAEVA